METDLRKTEEIIGYRFRDEKLLLTALTHSSMANEQGKGHLGSNERLEFLGDAVLEEVISAWLYMRWPEKPEGELTRLRAGLVCESSLARVCRSTGLNGHIRLGKGAELGGGRERDSIISDCVEAVIGAVYLDGGRDAAESLIMRLLAPEKADEGSRLSDPKTELQERLQTGGNASIEYRMLSEEGPDHMKSFTYAVLVEGAEQGRGSGRSNQAAQQAAASDALKRLFPER